MAETPQGLTVILGRFRAGDAQAQDGRQPQVMTLRDFGGMTVAEVAAALRGSMVTVEKEWRPARAWLAAQVGGWDG